MSIFFIIAGILVFLIGLYLVFSFLGDFKIQVDKMNEVIESDEFGLIVNLREEVDELNNSYYDILERQDVRISELELAVSGEVGNSAPSVEEGAEETNNIDRNKIVSLLSEGKTVEDVAIELGVDRSTVELVYSVNLHES